MGELGGCPKTRCPGLIPQGSKRGDTTKPHPEPPVFESEDTLPGALRHVQLQEARKVKKAVEVGKEVRKVKKRG